VKTLLKQLMEQLRLFEKRRFWKLFKCGWCRGWDL